MGLVIERNQALDTNPPAGDQYLSINGSNWLWFVTAVYFISFLVLVVLSFRPRHGERIFHYLFIIALLVGAIAYFAQASDLAWRVVPQNNLVNAHTRQIFWAKYINWVVAFPVVIIMLGLLSTVSWASIVYNVALSWIWIISYLVSAFIATKYKWAFFMFGTIAWLVLAIGTFTDGRVGANRAGSGRHYLFLASWVNMLWFFYPIAYGLSDGSNRIGVTGMFIWFGILDILMIPVLAYVTIALSRNWDYDRLTYIRPYKILCDIAWLTSFPLHFTSRVPYQSSVSSVKTDIHYRVEVKEVLTKW